MLLSLHNLHDKCGVRCFFDLVLTGCGVTLFLSLSWRSEGISIGCFSEVQLECNRMLMLRNTRLVDWLRRFLQRASSDFWEGSLTAAKTDLRKCRSDSIHLYGF